MSLELSTKERPSNYIILKNEQFGIKNETFDLKNETFDSKNEKSDSKKEKLYSNIETYNLKSKQSDFNISALDFNSQQIDINNEKDDSKNGKRYSKIDKFHSKNKETYVNYSGMDFEDINIENSNIETINLKNDFNDRKIDFEDNDDNNHINNENNDNASNIVRFGDATLNRPQTRIFWGIACCGTYYWQCALSGYGEGLYELETLYLFPRHLKTPGIVLRNKQLDKVTLFAQEAEIWNYESLTDFIWQRTELDVRRFSGTYCGQSYENKPITGRKAKQEYRNCIHFILNVIHVWKAVGVPNQHILPLYLPFNDEDISLI